MTTALEDWANQQRTDGAGHEHDVDESAITGPDTGANEEAGAEVDVPAEYDAVGNAASEEEVEALARKKKQGMQVILGAAGLCVMLLVCFVGVGIMKRNAAQQAQQVEVAQQGPEQRQAGQPSDLQVAPVGAPASATEQGIIMEHADGSPALAGTGGPTPGSPPTLDFGLQSGVGAPAAASAPIAATSNPVIQAPAQPLATAPAAIAAAPKTLPAAAQTQAVATKADASASDLDKMRAEITALRSDLAEKAGALDSLRGEVSSLRAQLVSRPNAPKLAQKPVAIAKAAPKPATEAPKPAATPAVVVVTEKGQPNNNPPLAVPTKGKVRSDFRIYAAVDGRFWVVGPDHEPVQVGVRSPLSDGSRVTSIDAEKNVIFTTAGEIR